MDTANAYAQGIVKDLRQRGLLPVAAFLVAALVALPLFMLKSSEPVSAPPAEPTAASADGLPSPEEALGAAGKPLVSLAVLDRPSDLDSFESKDPFEPIDQVSADGATQGTVAPITGGSASYHHAQLRQGLVRVRWIHRWRWRHGRRWRWRRLDPAHRGQPAQPGRSGLA